MPYSVNNTYTTVNKIINRLMDTHHIFRNKWKNASPQNKNSVRQWMMGYVPKNDHQAGMLTTLILGGILELPT